MSENSSLAHAAATLGQADSPHGSSHAVPSVSFSGGDQRDETLDALASFRAVVDTLQRVSALAGGLLGLIGVLLIIAVVALQEVRHKLTEVEFIAVLAVGTLLSLVGPLVIAYTAASTGRSSERVETSKEGRRKAEAEAITEQVRLENKRLDTVHDSPATPHATTFEG